MIRHVTLLFGNCVLGKMRRKKSRGRANRPHLPKITAAFWLSIPRFPLHKKEIRPGGGKTVKAGQGERALLSDQAK